MKDKIKLIFKDSSWTICGLVLMNVAVQFLVYPMLNKLFGNETYGNIIFFLSVMNVLAITFGTACSYTRLTESANKKTRNAEYLLILFVMTAIMIVIFSVFSFFYRKELGFTETVLYVILSCLTMWRYYADVEYRLTLNYKGYFLYYAIITGGYLIGIFIVSKIGFWPLALIPGEIAGLLFVGFKGTIFKPDFKCRKLDFATELNLFSVLCTSYFLNSLIYNGDRILVKLAIGSVGVSIYYVSSLFGKTMSLITTPFNSVISGYLAKYKGVLTRKNWTITVILLVLAALLVAALCTLGSYIVLPFLYNDLFHQAKSAFFICNLAQTIYFATNILSVILLRFADHKFQIYINIVYAIAFFLICLPCAFVFKMQGFYIGFLITAASKFMYSAWVGYHTIYKSKTQEC